MNSRVNKDFWSLYQQNLIALNVQFDFSQKLPKVKSRVILGLTGDLSLDNHLAIQAHWRFLA